MRKRKKINPRYKLDQFLLYTTEEGGSFKFLGDFTWKRFSELVEKGYFEFQPGDYIERVYPAYACLCKGRRGWDFRIDEINGDRKEFKGSRVERIEIKRKK